MVEVVYLKVKLIEITLQVSLLMLLNHQVQDLIKQNIFKAFYHKNNKDPLAKLRLDLIIKRKE